MLFQTLDIWYHSKKVLSSNPPAGRGLSVWSLHVLSGLLPQSKDTQFVWLDNLETVNLSLCVSSAIEASVVLPPQLILWHYK